jgi:hypothetical protein
MFYLTGITILLHTILPCINQCLFCILKKKKKHGDATHALTLQFVASEIPSPFYEKSERNAHPNFVNPNFAKSYKLVL